jgi:hypothetical protein
MADAFAPPLIRRFIDTAFDAIFESLAPRRTLSSFHFLPLFASALFFDAAVFAARHQSSMSPATFRCTFLPIFHSFTLIRHFSSPPSASMPAYFDAYSFSLFTIDILIFAISYAAFRHSAFRAYCAERRHYYAVTLILIISPMPLMPMPLSSPPAFDSRPQLPATPSAR